MRIGFGYDVHRLAPGRPMVLGGVTIPHDVGPDGHSDADVLLHAVCDALLGAAALGDIGQHFPNTDVRWKGTDSRALLREVVRLVGDGLLLQSLSGTPPEPSAVEALADHLLGPA